MEEQLNLELEGGENAVTEEQRAKARSMGWAPKEKWRGDPEQWVDADEFLRRGEQIMPVLRASNRKLEEQNAALAAQLNELRGSMNAFVEVQRDILKQRLDAERAELRKKLREARDAGEDDQVDAIEESLDENREKQRELEAKPAAPRQNPAEQAILQQWIAANPWYNGAAVEDQRKTALALQFGREANASGLKGQAFFDYIDGEMAKLSAAPARPGKVESGRPSGAGAGGSSGFDRLPAEAKAQAKKEAERFVGPNKMFKTEAEWFKHFAKLYGEE